MEKPNDTRCSRWDGTGRKALGLAKKLRTLKPSVDVYIIPNTMLRAVPTIRAKPQGHLEPSYDRNKSIFVPNIILFINRNNIHSPGIAEARTERHATRAQVPHNLPRMVHGSGRRCGI